MTEPVPPAPALTDLGAGRPLVFLHGWSVDRSFFLAQESLARDGFRVLVHPTCPATATRPLGADGRPPWPASPTRSAALISTIPLSTARFSSAGRWAPPSPSTTSPAAAQGRIAGLVMVDMSPKVANGPDWPHGLVGGQDLEGALGAADRMEGDWPLYAPRIARAMFAAGHDEASPHLARATERIAARDPTVMAALWRSLVQADHRATVAGLPVPLLAVAGAKSQLYSPAVADWIAATAPQGRARIITEAGHAPHMEQPAAFNAALAGFARSL
jgi:pimeloyl-[acyl-carrier protein] methyl ester esterase